MADSERKAEIELELEHDRVRRAIGPDGHVLYEAQWQDDWLRALQVRTPIGGMLELVTGRGEHPIIGPCDALRTAGSSEVLAFCGRTDWHRPLEIPPLDRPGALPPGGGAALLNVLAFQARHAAVPALRYRGPYPTVALFESLRGSFRVEGDAAHAEEIFTRDVEDAAIAGRMSRPAVDFIPDPHVWTWPSPRVCVQHRDGIERVWVDGHAFDLAQFPQLGRPRQLVATPDGDIAVVVMLAGQRVAEILRVSALGQPRYEPRPLPPPPADLVGKPLPEEMLPVLAEAIAADTPRLLRAAVRDVLRPGAVRWGDPGLALVLARDDELIVHAGLVEHMPEEPVALLGVFVELFALPVRRLAQRRLSEAAEALLRR